MTKDKIIPEEEIDYKKLWKYQKDQADMWEKLYENSSTAHQSTINKLLAVKKNLAEILGRLK